MKKYSVTPNADVSGWFIKLEDVAAEEEYFSKDDAIQAAEKMAQENSPSKLEILDKYHTVIEEKTY
ncbi:DUF2188 domain-containing protein [Virgibacillus sp. NKC19-3]|uniref:DUF2188 domain-containing protein n=1 Tax=Virgibacillus saliphilus TaxID=2831674 RepID=UPI001C9B9DDB|nr:DUF2188 domain-containing protein [Virgibacillus sp. NKC19-3]MBY7144174.1 DUF2188 domain-containing protein [Virgibacillus sp. NKC19-3]